MGLPAQIRVSVNVYALDTVSVTLASCLNFTKRRRCNEPTRWLGNAADVDAHDGSIEKALLM